MKKVRWIIQDNLIAENDRKELQANLKERGIAFHSVDVVPFSKELPDFPLDDQHENIYYGSTTFIANLYEQLDKPIGVFFDPDTFTAERQMEAWGDDMLNAKAELMTIKEFLAKDFPKDKHIFVRPNGDGKEFNGTVAVARPIRMMLEGILHNDEKVDDSFQILVGDAFRLGREWRLYVVKNEIVTASQYRDGHRLTQKSDAPSEVKRFARKMIHQFVPSEVFALDICEYFEDGEPHLAVLECGNYNSVGFYHCDKEAYMEGAENWVTGKLMKDNTLMIHGVEHPWDKEIEIFSDNEFGFNCTLEFTFESTGETIIETRHNCTEFHHLFESLGGGRGSSAFESDIHGTGGTKELKNVRWIKVEYALKLHDGY